MGFIYYEFAWFLTKFKTGKSLQPGLKGLTYSLNFKYYSAATSDPAHTLVTVL
jgi:hypothetical protein